LFVLSFYAVGVPDRPRTRADALSASLIGCGAATVGVSLLQLVVGDALLPRFVVLGSGVILVPLAVLCTRVAQDLDGRSKVAERVLMVGDLSVISTAVIDVETIPERPVTLTDVIDFEAVRSSLDENPLVDAAVANRATLLVLDGAAAEDANIVRQAAQLHEQGVRVRTLLDFYEGWIGKLPIAELERASLLFDIAEIHASRYLAMKRVLDVLVGLVLGLAFAVATPFVALANLFGNRGPLFYSQPRVGKGGEVFEILKFRTMVAPSESKPESGPESGPVESDATDWTAANDPRITPFGRILRRSHLDELPQAINVLRGELSVVGPRPEQPRYVAELAEKLPYYRLRHLVRPGLTGWAQVKYGYAGNDHDAREKLQYEFYYLRNQRLSFDLRILVRTIRSVLGGEGSGR
jgi:lipopolysaccharide/colanic/teichoic acid biosynthesis glycosyltransferase